MHSTAVNLLVEFPFERKVCRGKADFHQLDNFLYAQARAFSKGFILFQPLANRRDRFSRWNTSKECRDVIRCNFFLGGKFDLPDLVNKGLSVAEVMRRTAYQRVKDVSSMLR